MDDIEKFENFFKLDVKTKELIMKCAPNSADVDLENSMKWANNLLDMLDMIKDCLDQMMNLSGVMSPTQKNINSNIDLIKQRILNSNYDYLKLRDVYTRNISGLRETIVNEVASKISGYTMLNMGNFQNIMGKCESINEYLHVMHMYIVNNENYYHNVKTIDSRANNHDGEINFRGIETPLSREVYENFSDDIDTPKADIVSTNNEVLIMIRDKGHALTVEITEENEKMFVKYFIPKICNAEKVNMLPGVRKVASDTTFCDSTSGIFSCKKEEFIDKLNTFILNVPSDEDMVFDDIYHKIA